MMRPKSWVMGCAGLAATITACATPRPAPSLISGQLTGANVLLVTIDTLRRDRVGAYGGTTGLTPTLDRLAAQGLRYSRATSHVPMTLPAHTSILTGLTPRRHGVHNNVAFRLDERVPTLATMMKAAGYRTGAFVGAFVLDARFGLSRGFDVYDDRLPHASATTFRFAERPAAEVVKPAGDWILSGPTPWFAWVHLFDPHAPYEAPPAYRAARSPYDAEVAYADAMFGQFLDRLRAGHALDRTLVIVTADHGESLGEHGEATHGLFAYDSTLAVPLIVSGPSIPARAVDAPAAHVDIVPTIADLVGIPAPSSLDGRSLASPPPSDRAMYFESLDANLTRDWAPLTGVIEGDWKLIDLPIRELYDRRVDPGEATNLADRDSTHRDALARVLAILSTPPAERARANTIDAEAAARLRSLGYAGGSAARARRYTDADDPKRLVALNERFNAALDDVSRGRGPEALAAFEAILAERPDFVTARTSAATVLIGQHRAADAVRLLNAAPADQATSPDLLAKLGTALREAGDYAGSARAVERARAAGNQNPELLDDLGVAYARMGRTREARAMFDALLAENPRAAGTWYNVGLLEMSQHREDEAAAAFRRAVDADPSYGDAWQALGAALVGRDRPAAIAAWRRAEALLPHDYDLLFNLGVVLADSDRPADALPYLERFAREAPRDRYASDIARVRTTIAKLQR
jgi:arylsulfatase A-like enzyme/tetratricopeptide (TPR) repeat protein